MNYHYSIDNEHINYFPKRCKFENSSILTYYLSTIIIIIAVTTMKFPIFLIAFFLLIQITSIHVNSGIIKAGPATLPVLKDAYYVCLKTIPNNKNNNNSDVIIAEHKEFFKELNQKGINFTVRHEFFDYVNGISLVLPGGLDSLKRVADVSVVSYIEPVVCIYIYIYILYCMYASIYVVYNLNFFV